MEKGKEAELTERIIACAIAVHRELGPGLLESIYEEALTMELGMNDLLFVRQVEMPVFYKGVALSGCFKADFVVEGKVVLELKSVEHILPVHEAQLLSYMKLGGWDVGLLINFKSAMLRDGIRRIVL
ncbi:MAG TPA: GxxExxY protein [Spirochaetia bacterium]|nr:GxxExxY protein [Spirochaetia bacterium]